jgi:competence protein ComEC
MNGRTRATLFVLVLVGLLAFRVAFYIDRWENEVLPTFAGRTLLVVGKVSNDPEHRATSTHVNLSVEKVDGKSVSGTMLIILPREVELFYGDHLAVAGQVILPQPFETNTGRMFDYAGYLQVQGVSTMMQKAKLVSVVPGGWSVNKFLYAIKHTFENSLEKLFPEPNASLLEGVLLGERRGLPAELNQAFITSGLVHVVVLSGYNISIVAESILRVTSFLPATLHYGFGAVFMILFALMSGAGATTVRALMMGLIAILARYLNRPTDALRALFAAAVVMVLWNPPVVLYDQSFILSVLATFGLITISPVAEYYLWWLPKYKHVDVRSIAASTLAVQFFVLPALLYITGVLSLVALPANIIALPVVPFAMLFGFLAGVAGFIHPVIALPFLYIAQLLLSWMIWVATSATSLPFSATVVQAFPVWVAVLLYIPLTAFAVYVYKKFSIEPKLQQTASRSRPN